MSEGLDLNAKQLARSKHFHSLNKDKNRYKKKHPHIIAAKKNLQSKENSEEDENEEQETVDKPRRRKNLPSNAYRYEENQEEENLRQNQEQQEENAYIKNLMLQMISSENEVGFQFSEEKEWDEETLSNYSSIDVEFIGTNLKQLPLSQLLGIEPNLFPEEVESIKEEESNVAQDVLNSFRITFDSAILMERSQKSSLNKTELTSLPKVSSSITKVSEINSKASSSLISNQVNISNTPKLSNLKEDNKVLDSLLNLDKQKKNSGNDTKETPSNQTQQSTPSQKEQLNKGEEDLESWLDTVI